MAIESGKTPEDFKKEFLDPVSDSYCMAKWYEATMWLYIGHTASCHHNPTHKIDLDPKAPGSLHNTPIKIHERNKMRKGEKPEGCRYCWNAEDMGVVSDRVYKSQGYDTKLIATSGLSGSGAGVACPARIPKKMKLNNILIILFFHY